MSKASCADAGSLAQAGSAGHQPRMLDISHAADWRGSFCASPFSLRFALGGETFGNDAPVPRFIQALGRARQIVDDAFRTSRKIVGVVTCSSDTTNDFFAPVEDAWLALRQAGFAATAYDQWSAPLWPNEDEEDEKRPSTWRLFDLTADAASRDVLIWCAISYEMAITPDVPVISWLVDPQRGVLAHIYDDRGMDVTALNCEPLTRLYHERNAWLLDYDRPRIEEAFGPIAWPDRRGPPTRLEQPADQ